MKKHTVDFVVVGGLAIAWHCPDRQADDMDLLINPSIENSERIYSALQELNLSGFRPDSFIKQGLQVPIKDYHYAELLTPKSEDTSFEMVASNAVKGQLFDISVLIASHQDLVAMKEKAAREQGSDQGKHNADLLLLQNVAA